MKLTQAFLILGLLLPFSSLYSATIWVTVNGLYYPDGNGPTFFATNGTESIAPSAIYPHVDYYTYGAYEDVWNSDTQSYDQVYIERNEPQWGTERTLYQVTVPDTWIGRSLAFTWDGGAAYTSYIPLVSEGTEYTYSYYDSSHNGSLPGAQYSGPPMDVLSNRILLGKWWSDNSRSLFTLNTWDNVDPNWPSMGMDFLASTPNVFWRWMHPSGSGGGVELAMELDYEHRLTLRRRGTPNHRIILDPVYGSISINGQSVLTRAALNSSLSLGPSAYAHYGGIAIGKSAYSSGSSKVEAFPDLPSSDGTLSVAVGDNAYSSAHGATALGSRAYANASFSLALGGYSRAEGLESLAIGLKSAATNTASMAVGPYSRATGAKSLALGYRTAAQGYGQAVVGVNNVPVGNANDPTALDSEVFIVGGGGFEWSGTTPVSLPRNSFTVKRGGDTHVTGKLTVSGAGESSISGDLRVQGVIRVPQAGDISMGGFTAGSQP